MANGYIGQIHIDNTDYKIGSTLFGVLNTSDNIGTITESNNITTFNVPIDGFVSTDGVTVHIKFVQPNSKGSNLQLKVGNDSARPIVNPNGALTWAANSIISFTNDGTNWVINASAIDGSSIQNLSLGNITNDGKLQTTDVTIDNGDKLVITDASDGNKIARASISFDGSTATKALTQKGTWETFNNYSLPTAKYNILGGLKPAYSSTGTATLTTNAASNSDTPTIAAKSTTSGRYYAVEVDKNGIPYVNVPWTDNSHWTTHLYVTGSSGTAVTNAALANGEVYLKLYDSANARESYKFEGDKGIEVITDASGNLKVQHTHTQINAKTAAAQSAKTLALGDTFTIYEEKYDTDGHITGVASYNMTMPSSIDWNKITANTTPTTLSGYGITDASINTSTGAIKLGSNTITPVTTVNGHTGSSVTVTASDLGLSKALRFAGKATTTMSESTTTAPTISGVTGYTPVVGDVVLDKDNEYEYVCVAVSGTTYTWEKLGSSSSYALDSAVIKKADFTKAHQIIYSSAASSPAFLDPNTTTTRKYLSMVGDGTNGAAPTWEAITKTTIGLGSVTNHQQVHEVAWDATNKKITRSKNGTAGNVVIFAAGGNISLSTATANTLTISATQFAGATSSSNGTAGYLAAPGSGNREKFLQGSGNWKTLSIPTIASVINGVLTITNVALSVT